MKKCDACGQDLRGGYSLGGTLLCRTCEPDVRASIAAARAKGKRANAMEIARRMYRQRFGNFPAAMMREMKERALAEGGSVRDLILVAVANYLAKQQRRKNETYF